MVGVALMFTGAVLLVNGLALCGKVDGPSVAVFNLIAGSLNVGVGIHSGLNGNPFGMGQLFLFAFTYLWMAWNVLAGVSDWRAFGWYCGFVAVMAVPTSLTTYAADAPWFGGFWMSWAVLWYLFFLMFGLGLKIRDMFAGVTTATIGIATAMVPGYLIASGTWGGG